MIPSILRHTRGVHTLITTFLFIMVVLFAVIATMYIGSILTAQKSEINDELSKYNYLMDAKNRILSAECYGQVIQEVGGSPLSANETCTFPEGIIKGYSIEMLAYQNCSNVSKVWMHRFSQEEAQIQPYFVPIMANGTSNVCPGKLRVMY